MTPQNLLYAKTHEWARVEADPAGGKIAMVGITTFALEMLTDLVYVALPEIGRKVEAGKPFGEIESVKAVSDLNSPVDRRGGCGERRTARQIGIASQGPLRRRLVHQGEDH